MIPRAAVDRYLNRDLDSHLWMKDLSRRDILAEINKLRPRPQLFDGLKLHQLLCFFLGVCYPCFAFWLDMGTGKTLITLELLKYWFKCGRIRRALIFITSDRAFRTWEKQIKLYKIGLPYTLLEGSSTRKWQQLQEFGDGLIFVSYPGAVAMVSLDVKKGRKVSWKLDKKLVKELARGLGAVAFDESTKVSNHNSLAYDLAVKLTDTVDTRYALAGRPFGRDPTLLWAQHYIIDRGETLGDTLGMFREAFFTSKPSFMAQKYGGRRGKYVKDFKFDKRMKGPLSDMIQHRSITYSADECIDLPPFLPILDEVAFSEEAEAYYDRAVDSIIAAKGNLQEIKSVFLRMRQLSSGFVGFKDDETGERVQVEFEENPKFDRLVELLEELPDDRKAVVFYDFTHSGRKIAEAGKELGLKPIWLWSGNKKGTDDLRKFEEVEDRRLAVVNNRIGAYSLDGLQVANYTFFYESPVSAIDREQAERRLRRQGQTRKVFQYDLIVRGSADQKILDYHKEAEGLMTSLLRNPRLLKRK